MTSKTKRQLHLSPRSNSNTTVGKYEAALYALLGCDTDAVLESPMCNRWVDQCWAMFRLALQARLDNIALLHRQQCLAETPEVAGPMSDKYDNQHITRIAPLLNTRAGRYMLLGFILIKLLSDVCAPVGFCVIACGVCAICLSCLLRMYVNMYVPLYICPYLCISVSLYIWISVYMDLRIYGSMHVCRYVYVDFCIDVSMYLCIYVSVDQCIYVSIYGAMYVDMYMWIYISVHLGIYVSMYL
jgi:hypothetical protein